MTSTNRSNNIHKSIENINKIKKQELMQSNQFSYNRIGKTNPSYDFYKYKIDFQRHQNYSNVLRRIKDKIEFHPKEAKNIRKSASDYNLIGNTLSHPQSNAFITCNYKQNKEFFFPNFQ